jgi:hypothetical protein
MVVTTSVRVVVQDLRGFTERLVQRLALNVTANLIEDTPVDTGWARSNWVPNIGSPRKKPAGVRPTSRGAPGLDSAPQAAGQVAIAGYRLGPSIFISNNVPYIKKLNAGSSRKAPAAFIQSAILRAVKATVSRSR